MKMPVRAFGFFQLTPFIRQRQVVSFPKPILRAFFRLLYCLSSCSAVTAFRRLCSVLGCLCSDRWTSRDMCRLGLRKYSSIRFYGIETSSKKCEFGRFVLGEEDGMRVSSELGQHAAVTDGLGQPSPRERCLCLGGHVHATSLSSCSGLYRQRRLESQVDTLRLAESLFNCIDEVS